MNTQIRKIAAALTALGGGLLPWSAMLSDGGAPIVPVLLLAALGLISLLAGVGLQYLCSPEGRALRRRLFAPGAWEGDSHFNANCSPFSAHPLPSAFPAPPAPCSRPSAPIHTLQQTLPACPQIGRAHV